MPAANDARADAAAFDFLDLLQADVTAQRRRPLAEYLSRFPEFQERIAREYLAATAEPEAAADAPAAAPTTNGDLFGNYRLQQLLGRGGQGAVYLCEDIRLQRAVALKILDVHANGIGTAQVERLRREAAALARLDHPGVCAIYEADINGERPFLAMRYVPGETLAARLAKAATSTNGDAALLGRLPTSTAEITRVLRFVERAAYALDAAHRAGLVHRDIKPANIMIDRDGMPVLLDFGLARMAEDAGLNLTLTGQVFGTLAYMSPEQLSGSSDLDARTDIYSLGVTLWECLTLQLPFRTESREVLDREIRSGAARRARSVNPAVSRDLCVVLATAMDRDRARRYATARAFADDLANVADRRPIQARSASIGLRLWRWQQRHPVVAATAALLLVLLIVMSWSVWQLQRTNRRLETWQKVTGFVQSSEDRPAEALAKMVDVARGEEQPQIREALHTVLSRTREAWRMSAVVEDPKHEPVATSASERQHNALLADPSRGLFLCISTWGYIYLREIATGRLSLCVNAHDKAATAVALSADRQTLVTGSEDGQIRLWSMAELDAGTPLTTIACAGCVWRCAFSPSGDRLAIAYAVNTGDQAGVAIAMLRIDQSGAMNAHAPLVLQGHRGKVNHLVFSADGRRLASLGEVPEWNGLTNQQLFVWDSASGERCLALDAKSLGADISSVCWTDDNALAITLHDVDITRGRLRLYDGEDFERFREHRFESWALWVGVIPGSDDLWVSTMDGVWVVAPESLTSRHVVVSTIERSFQNAVFSPDGQHAAVAVRDSSIRVIETRTWHEVANLRLHEGYVHEVLWSADGRSLVSADDAELHGWNHLARPFMAELLGHDGRVPSISFAPDSGQLVTAGEDGSVRLWDRANARQTSMTQLDKPRRTARFSPSGRYVVSVGETDTAHVLERAGPARSIALTGHTDKVTDAWITVVAGEERAVTIADDGNARLWDVDRGVCLRTYSGNTGPLRYAAIDAQRGWLATGGEDRQRVHVFDLVSGATVQTLQATADPPRFLGMQGRVRGLQFLPRSGRLAVSAESSPATFWDLASSTRTEVGAGGSTGWIATDAAERWLVIAEYSVPRMTWVSADLQQQERFESREPTSWISKIEVRRQGDIGLVACRDGSVWLYDWLQRDVYSVLRAKHGAVLDACFSADGQWVAAAYRDGTALVWPVEPMPAAERYHIPSLR